MAVQRYLATQPTFAPTVYEVYVHDPVVPGIDSIFIGPADLSASMGLLGDMGNPAVQDKLSAGAQTCKRLGKPCGIVGANPEVVGKFLQYGFSWVAVGSDLAMLTSRAQEFLSAVRSTVAGMPRP